VPSATPPSWLCLPENPLPASHDARMITDAAAREAPATLPAAAYHASARRRDSREHTPAKRQRAQSGGRLMPACEDSRCARVLRRGARIEMPRGACCDRSRGHASAPYAARFILQTADAMPLTLCRC